ncbi:MAG: glutamyl-tRNA reductase [Chloroflexota bacterium]|nr:glutamyl-tRNA reductase [Chloroflexota bacterium]
MTVLLLGVNHRTADIDLRDRLSLAPREVRDLLSNIAPAAAEIVALSTCNRTEIYAVAQENVAPALLRALSAHTRVPEAEIAAHSYTRAGEDAIRHLLAVASGLDSVVLGEGQILGQVRGAWEVARAAGTVGPTLNTLFRYALQAGKEIRSQTVVARGATSVAHAAVELARREFGSLANRNVLVLGAGATGRVAALNLRSAGAGKIAITNRTAARADALAAELHGDAVVFDALPDALRDTDMLIACSSSTEPLVTQSMLKGALSGRGERPLLVIDIALPRNVESAAREVPGVLLYDMDNIQDLCERNKHARSAAARRAKGNIDAWAARYAQWQREREAVPLIQHLRAQAEQVRQEELAAALRRLPNLTTQERAEVEALSRSMLNRLMHQPLVWLKERSTPEQRELLGALWTPDEPGPDTGAR